MLWKGGYLEDDVEELQAVVFVVVVHGCEGDACNHAAACLIVQPSKTLAVLDGIGYLSCLQSVQSTLEHQRVPSEESGTSSVDAVQPGSMK
jgi:hypothetical protein